MRDIQLALRLLSRNRSVTAIALLSIALSVATTAVVFTAVRTVLIAPMPYLHPSELVQIRTDFPKFEPSHSDWTLWNDAQEIARRTRTLSSVAVYRNEMFNLSGDGTTPPEALYGLRVTANLFPTLGVEPMLGRNIAPDEDQPGHANEMILSYGLWTRRFHADPSVVGLSVVINGQNCLIIGVMPQEFDFPLRRAAAHTPSPYVDFWAPLRSGKAVAPSAALGVVARLRPGSSLQAAQQDLAGISSDLTREFPPTNRDHILRVGLLRDRMLGNAKGTLWILMAAAGMFSLIGCANVANLLLARGWTRQREIAIRLAIGAARARIVRQLLTESCVLAGIGGAAGYCLTVLAWPLVSAFVPASVPRLRLAHPDWHVLVFSLVVAIVNGVLFGVFPAYAAGWARTALLQNLRGQGGIAGRGNRMRGTLVAAEVALALALVVVGGQLLASFAALLKVDPGFDAKRVTAFVVIPDPARYATPEKRASLYRHILDSVRYLPGVAAAGTVDGLPFSGENTGGLLGANQEATPLEKQVPAEIDMVSADYLQTMGVRLLQGRWFRPQDMDQTSDAVIVNDLVAQQLWPGAGPIGKRICVFCAPGSPGQWKQVVGVVSVMHHASVDKPERYSAYLASGALESAAFLVVRSGRPVADIQKAVGQVIAAIDPNQPVFFSASLQSLVDYSLEDRRFVMILLASTGCLALAMAAAGVFGVATYVTSRRTQEIGLRMALGATRGGVEALVFRQGFLSAAIGLIAGLSGALASIKSLRGVLPGLESAHGGDIWVEVGLVALTAAIACWLPARRAANLDPNLALREE